MESSNASIRREAREPVMTQNEPTVALCTLCLNEMEWLARLYEQHRNWPGLLKWVFVEAADVVYAKTNPDMVTSFGLSVDGTSDYLRNLSREDSRIVWGS